MRLTPQQIQLISVSVILVAGEGVSVRLFGSRLNGEARGGDVDLMLEFATPIANPALLSARLAAKISRAMQGRKVAMQGRKVDVLLSAANLLRFTHTRDSLPRRAADMSIAPQLAAGFP